jgi:hypothetical protein
LLYAGELEPILMHTRIPLSSPPPSRLRCAYSFAALALLAVALGAPMLFAQAPPTPSPTHAPSVHAHTPAHAHKRRVAAAPQPAPPPAVLVPLTPPEPPAPLWPANDNPTPAEVVWDSQGLRINAANSSLEQILNDVAAATGAKVEGFAADQRVFGVYGPASARDVLGQLLQGSGYNVLLIGDQGQGTPREIVLSTRHAGTAHMAGTPTASGNDDADVDEPPQPTPPPMLAPSGNDGPRTPQQEMQEHQQRMQRQRGQPQPPDNPPN